VETKYIRKMLGVSARLICAGIERGRLPNQEKLDNEWMTVA
jgi:hypothetical protein